MGCLIVAEVGVNHDGDLNKALALAEAAKQAGADAVKFQCFDSRALWGDARIANLELTRDGLRLLKRRCDGLGIEFMCTPFGVPEVLFLAPLVQRMKIASGCLNRPPLLEAVRETGLPVILSTGMSEYAEIETALARLDRDKVTLLHCTSAYPCPLEEVNLLAMDELSVRSGLPVGFSDHTDGNAVAVAAAAIGAEVIEKHFTFDKNAPGPDHKASITPMEFAGMVTAIRIVEKALGDGRKRVMPSEAKLREAWRR